MMASVRFLPVLSLVLLAGCGMELIADRTTNPVISNFEMVGGRKVGVLSTTAERRAIVVFDGGPNGTVVCPGPSPDAIAALSHSVDASLKADAGKVSGESSLQSAAALSASLGLYRSQGPQDHREKIFAGCLLYGMGRIDTKQYFDLISDPQNETGSLIAKEMPAIIIAAGKGYMTLSAPELTKIIRDAANDSASGGTTPANGAGPKKSTKPATSAGTGTGTPTPEIRSSLQAI
jgi:hypothetical protein